MRVPSIGEPLDERRIVREAYRIAEHMMRDYQDPPSFASTVGAWLRAGRQTMASIYRVLLRD